MFLYSISWGSAAKCRYKAGYGSSGRMYGIQVSTLTQNDTFTLRPRNSVGAAESCSFEIPASSMKDVAELLLSAIAETAPKSEIATGSVESLISEHGHWGEHPVWTREVWYLEVRERNTQRGYWDWVSASLESPTGRRITDALLSSTDGLGQSQ
jgi:hypothetical protein